MTEYAAAWILGHVSFEEVTEALERGAGALEIQGGFKSIAYRAEDACDLTFREPNGKKRAMFVRRASAILDPDNPTNPRKSYQELIHGEPLAGRSWTYLTMARHLGGDEIIQKVTTILGGWYSPSEYNEPFREVRISGHIKLGRLEKTFN